MANKLRTSDELTRQINDSIAEAEGIIDAAQADERELTSDEQGRIDEIQTAVGESATDDKDASGLWLTHEQAVKRENFIAKNRNRLAATPGAQRAGDIVASQYGDAKPKPQVHGLGVPRRKLRAFTGPNAEQNAYAAGMWIKATISKHEGAIQWCADNGMDVRAAQTEGVDAAGGYTVPDPLMDALVAVRAAAGISRQLSRVVSMPSDTLSLPKRTAGVTVYYPGEASAITASDMTFSQINLSCVKRACMTELSNELLRDSVLSIADEVATDAGHALAWQEDNEFINGDSSSTYGSETGLITALGAAGKHTLDSGETAWSDVALADFNLTVAKVPDKWFREGQVSWIMRRDLKATVVDKLLYAAGGNTVTTIGADNQESLFGYPIHFTDRMPADAADKAIALFGNFFESCVIGDRDTVEISASEHYGFNKDVTTLRATARYDIAVHEGGSGSVAGGYVGMFTAAS